MNDFDESVRNAYINQSEEREREREKEREIVDEDDERMRVLTDLLEMCAMQDTPADCD